MEATTELRDLEDLLLLPEPAGDAPVTLGYQEDAVPKTRSEAHTRVGTLSPQWQLAGAETLVEALSLFDPKDGRTEKVGSETRKRRAEDFDKDSAEKSIGRQKKRRARPVAFECGYDKERKSFREKQRRQELNEGFAGLAEELDMNPKMERTEMLKHAKLKIRTLKEKNEMLVTQLNMVHAQYALFLGSALKPIPQGQPQHQPMMTKPAAPCAPNHATMIACMMRQEEHLQQKRNQTQGIPEITHSHCA